MTSRALKTSSSSIARCPLYGISPLALHTTLRVPADYAERWKAHLRANPTDAAIVARFMSNDLGAFDSAWAGWVCKDGLIWPPDTAPATPAQVLAIPYMREQLREFERAQRWMLEQSHAEQLSLKARNEALEFMARATEALRQR